jgi:uncharacterized protein YoxC
MKNSDNSDNAEDPVMKALADLTKSVSDLAGKVETIEKARSPSTSVNDDGGTDDVEVNKNDVQPGSAGFWSGALF